MTSYTPEIRIRFITALFSGVMFLSFSAYGSSGLNEHLVLATTEMEPYTINDSSHSGFLNEIVIQAYEHSGYSVKVIFLPWKRAVLSVKEGLHDGLVVANLNSEREAFMTYSKALIQTDFVFYKRAKNYIDEDNLSNYRIGFVRGGVITKRFHTTKWLKKEELRNTEHALKMLLASRIDLLISQRLIIPYQLESRGKSFEFEKIEVLNTVYESIKAYTTISKKKDNHEEIILNFNKGLEALKNTGQYQNILTKYKAESASVFPSN